ncbi:NAD(P)H-hydrate dehydratase [Dysgonomonas sp. 216]|uniref:NAD(P)H-hydrate dehydratase n=1 Tax=Dysgonomonas sp. 216 TaxID=2302934 RepID=UPI0013D24CD2|nr:NAD(P)H-hydrate dehydratase [Dysgonomonas sp. 216]NDW17983.1 NAD(P)H-hydrate dehydratase [Dysgonomonas sp. 216]
MLKILNAEQVRVVDKCTVEEQEIRSVDLMERAALAVAGRLLNVLSPRQSVYVFAGTGNNGGDALAVARILLSRQFEVKSFLVTGKGRFSPDCAENKRCLERISELKEISSSSDIPLIPSNSVVVDGLFGSGLNRPVEGVYADVIRAINKSDCRVFSIDIPSGMFTDDNSGAESRQIVKADEVFTFQMPKLSLLLPESDGFCRKMTIVDIGLAQRPVNAAYTEYFYLEKKDLALVLKPLSRFAHKGNNGRAILFAGSYGKVGAAVLAAKACLRTGIGLLTVHLPRCGVDVMQTAVPEAMVEADKSDCGISGFVDKYSDYAIGIGSGIGVDEDTKNFLCDIFKTYPSKPLVLDADALNIIARERHLLDKIPLHSILTPHPVEFDRLSGMSPVSGYERLQQARVFAERYGVYVVLKGAYTAIVTPEKNVYFNSTGNPGMATGGSGDALTGVVLSLLAQKYTPLDAAMLGVYLHGLAGDLAVLNLSQRSLLPSDLIEHIGMAYKSIEL